MDLLAAKFDDIFDQIFVELLSVISALSGVSPLGFIDLCFKRGSRRMAVSAISFQCAGTVSSKCA